MSGEFVMSYICLKRQIKLPICKKAVIVS